MPFFETLQLSLIAILSNRLRSFLTILGIVIGVLSVIILVALVTGLQDYITGQISSFGSNLVFVIPGKEGATRGPGGVVVNRLELQDATLLEKELKGQAQVSATIQKSVTLKFSNQTLNNTSLYGTDFNYPSIVNSVKVAKGRYFNQSEADAAKRVAVIGQTVVNKFFLNRNPIGQRISVGNVRYEVIGVLESQGSTFGLDQDNAVYTPLIAVRQQFGINNINGIYVSAKTAAQVKPLQKDIKTILSKRLSIDDFTVSTQEQALTTINQITGVLTAALGGIAAISLLVGGIGVSNIMLVSVTERTREIGLRKALGARPKDIRNQFLIEAVTLCALGGTIGIVLGYIITAIINQFFTASVPLWSVGLSFGFSMLVGIVFGVAPAIRAARLDPITALRYE